jgi:hypothetical protein
MTEVTARAALYSRLSEVIGVDNAGTLMSYLPGEEPATKLDIRRLEERIDHLDERIDHFDDKLDRRMDEFHFALLAQGRTYVIASIGSIISTGALVAAITGVMG